MNSKLSQWWSSVKRIVDMTPASGSDIVNSSLQVEGIGSLSEHVITNMINSEVGIYSASRRGKYAADHIRVCNTICTRKVV